MERFCGNVQQAAVLLLHISSNAFAGIFNETIVLILILNSLIYKSTNLFDISFYWFYRSSILMIKLWVVNVTHFMGFPLGENIEQFKVNTHVKISVL